MLYHFQYRSEDRWEAIGSGEGGGIEAPVTALAELNGLTGHRLPPGSYRCIAATAASAYWEYLVIDADGATRFAEEEPIEDDVVAAAEPLSASGRTPHRV